ncbi:type IV pilus secretin PilQ [bacterium]|nr:type IV pilus secretin PilQ [bacterium]
MKKQTWQLSLEISAVLFIVLCVFTVNTTTVLATTHENSESTYQHALKISNIETQTINNGLEILIKGNKTLNYKTYTFESPTRIAIDFKGFGLNNVQDAISVNQGYVSTISNKEFSNEREILTRVEIFLTADISDKVSFDQRDTTLSIFIPNDLTAVAGTRSKISGSESESVRDVLSEIEASSPSISIPEPKTMSPRDIPFVQLAQQSSMPQTATAGTYIEKTIGTDDIHQSSELPIYEGIPISLDLKNADIIDIFLTISELTGYNVIIDPKVKGKINIRMNEVPWDQALDIILRQMELGKEYTGTKSPEFPRGNIIRIASVSSLRKEANERKALLDAQKVAEPLITKIIYLSYSKAQQMQSIVKKLLSRRGEIIVDKRTNSLLITDIPANLDKVRNMITLLDVRTKQVLIMSKIITTKKDFSRELGITWGANVVGDAIHGNTTGYRFPNNYNMDYAVSLPSGNNILGVSLGNILDTFNLSAILSASEAEGLTKVISNPRVLTSDNVEAMIKSGTQIPYIIETDEGFRYAFKEAVIQLKVTPHVTHDNFIQMDVEIKKDAPDYTFDPPGILTNRASTDVLVKDGDTFVIGGLNQTTTGWDSSRIPFVHNIPIIGWLFKNKRIKNEYDDLLVFITPKLVQQEQTQVKAVSFDESILPSEEKKSKK